MSKKITRIGIVLLVAISALAFHYLHWDSYFTLDNFKANQGSLQEFYAANPVSLIAGYMAVYILVTAASLPGAAIMTLAGGALFGGLVGTVIVSFASTLGATGAFLLSRFVFRDFAKRKFRAAFEKIDRGITNDGTFYLFSLRMIPLFPFFVINAVMGLTGMPVRTYFWVSQVGMLLGTVAYVNAGTQLSQMTSLKGVVSPAIVLSFAFLGVLPILAKVLLAALKSRRTLGRFKRPKKYDYNLIVIGGGSAGLVSAYIAATVRAKVALIEKAKMGGDCLNTGCVPSKALIRSAKAVHTATLAKSLGLRKVAVEFEFSEIMDRVQKVVAEIAPHDSIARYQSLGVECLTGEAKILSPFEVAVNGKTLTTKNIIVATGALPQIPNLPGLDKSSVLTSETVWQLRKLPKRLIVLGGGPIGCEMAQAFSRLGAEVTLVERGTQILPREDHEVAALVQKTFSEEGIAIRTQCQAKAVVSEGGKQFLVVNHANQESRIEYDGLFCALGRKANVRGFGLEALGVTLSENGTIAADEFLRTNFPNILVCGDVAGPYQFTHVASHQAWFASVNALFSPFKKFKVDYRVIPWTTFTDPEIARVGLSEKEAAERNIAVEVTSYGIEDLDRAIADGEARGFVKVLTEPGKDKILGVTIASAHAGEFITEYITAMKYGIGLNKILGTIHVYPTFGEANKYAAGVWKKKHAPEGILKRVQKFHAWRRNERTLPF